MYAVEGDYPSSEDEFASCLAAGQIDHQLSPTHGSLHATTGADGRARFSGSLPYDDSAHCFPGAPCAVMSLHHWLLVAKDGYVSYEAPARASVVKLLGPEAKVRNHRQALELANRDPGLLRLRGLLLAEPEPQPIDGRNVRSLEPRSCLSAEGGWSAIFPGALLPHNDEELRVPAVQAQIEPFEGSVKLVSCPGEGSELEIVEASAARVRVRDVDTRAFYECNGCNNDAPEMSFCARPLEPGETMIDLDVESELRLCVPAPREPFKLPIGEQRRSGVGSIFGAGVADLRGCKPSPEQPLVLVQ